MKRIIFVLIITLMAVLIVLWSPFGRASEFNMTKCSVTFSPNGGTAAAIIAGIDNAKRTVRVLTYSFTSTAIADALINAHKRGVDVAVVIDKTAATGNGSALPLLQAAGVPYKVDRVHAIAHNKTIIIDNTWVETGSYNYSIAAEKSNAENALICKSTAAYAFYRADWEKHWAHSKDK